MSLTEATRPGPPEKIAHPSPVLVRRQQCETLVGLGTDKWFLCGHQDRSHLLIHRWLTVPPRDGSEKEPAPRASLQWQLEEALPFSASGLLSLLPRLRPIPVSIAKALLSRLSRPLALERARAEHLLKRGRDSPALSAFRCDLKAPQSNSSLVERQTPSMREALR